MRKLMIGTAIVLALIFGFASATQSTVRDLGNGKILVVNEIKFDTPDFLDFTSEDKNYHIIIQSPGGHARDTITMMQRIRDLQLEGYTITTECMQECYSGGAMVWLMGDHRIAHKGDLFMFHEAVMVNRETKNIVPESELTDAQKKSRLRITSTIRELMLSHVRDTELIKKLMNPAGNADDGTNSNWFTVDEMMDMGLVDEIK
jgi:ATP-dependent protease ClpP protease subunit